MAPQKSLLFVIFVLVLVSLACGALTPPTPTEPPPPTPTFTPLPPTNTPEPTATLAPTNTPQPTATPVPKPGDVIFRENFDDNANKWSVGSSADVLPEIASGIFQVTIKRLDSIYRWRPLAFAALEQSDVDISMDVTFKEGNFDDVSVGISCKHQVIDQEFYFWQLYASGRYRLMRRSNNTWTTLAGPAYVGAMKTGYATNNIRVICAGETLRFIVNDQPVFTFRDATFAKAKNFAIHVGNYQSPSVKVALDNLVVRLANTTDIQTAGGSATGSTVNLTAAPAATARPSGTSAPASTGEALKQRLQQLKIVAQSLAAISDGTARVGGGSGGGFDCGQFVNLYASLSRYPTFDASSESPNIQQANLKYADAIKRLTKDSKLMNDWCFKWATGDEGKNLTIGYDIWNPAREASNYAFVVINQALDLLK